MVLLLLLLRSVCVAKAAVGVAGQCLVRPELTFEYLTHRSTIKRSLSAPRRLSKRWKRTRHQMERVPLLFVIRLA